MRPGEEADWLARARQGDDDAFAVLVDSYQRPVYNLCRRMLGDAQEAEDAAQEAFLKAYLGLQKYDPKRSFRTWLLSIAAHECIDQLRRRRFQWVPLEAAFQASEPEGGPEAQLEQALARDQLQLVLSRLAPVDRGVIVLRYWNDFSYAEIAETLKLSPAAVKTRLHRAKKAMAARWLEMDVGSQKALGPGRGRGHNEVAAV
jgi:RNA polymerase sigma-70 factor (ECF subfamily)